VTFHLLKARSFPPPLDLLPHDNRFLVHLDGKDMRHDYWADATCAHVHPVDWCKGKGRPLVPPPEFRSDHGKDRFEWSDYLTRTAALPVPARAFKIRPQHGNGFRGRL
jgi:hypothetical protein